MGSASRACTLPTTRGVWGGSYCYSLPGSPSMFYQIQFLGTRPPLGTPSQLQPHPTRLIFLSKRSPRLLVTQVVTQLNPLTLASPHQEASTTQTTQQVEEEGGNTTTGCNMEKLTGKMCPCSPSPWSSLPSSPQ